MNGIEHCTFLRDPNEISAAILDLMKEAGVLRLAVGFISPHWRSIFAHYVGNVQVICWLSSTNTNPYAVGEMTRDARFEVRQADSMHAKVYLAPGVGAIVCSANLSGTALSDSDTAGQYEAAVFVRDLQIVQDITDWFDSLWQSTTARKITDDDLTCAKTAVDRAKANRGPSAVLPSAHPVAAAMYTISHLTSMPVSPKHGSPLYSSGAIRDVFQVVAMCAGGATAAEIRALAKKEVALHPVTEHCREDGRQGWCWDLFIDGKCQSVDPKRGFLRAAFQSLPGSARIQLSNFRHAKRHADSTGWSSM